MISSRFQPGQSGNPKGRPKKRRPNVSAFDIIFDKVLTVTQGGRERELTVDEALQLQTYQAALKGSKMAVRQVLKMIEKREVALARRNAPAARGVTIEHEHCSDNARDALRILDIVELDPSWGGQGEPRMSVTTWAAQAALSRPGKRKLSEKDVKEIKFFTSNSDQLKWPRGSGA